MSARDKSDSFVREVGCDSENAADKLRILERLHEEKQREIKNLMDDVKVRDYEIKNLQECITHLLREKNDLQDKIEVHRATCFLFFSFSLFFFLQYSSNFLNFDPTAPSKGVPEQTDDIEEEVRRQFERAAQEAQRKRGETASEIRGYHESREGPVRRGELAAGARERSSISRSYSLQLTTLSVILSSR